ncbi:hypothetical protein BaRGS_00008618 [Batillaria attramentaria]|uniref:Uncharacterized protein n=1 Tax=Batillaria attramentaria TaxID=370345 RepID=A0ABD0LLE0_9CAEN
MSNRKKVDNNTTLSSRHGKHGYTQVPSTLLSVSVEAKQAQQILSRRIPKTLGHDRNPGTMTHCLFLSVDSFSTFFLFASSAWKRQSRHTRCLRYGLPVPGVLANQRVLIFHKPDYVLAPLWRFHTHTDTAACNQL